MSKIIPEAESKVDNIEVTEDLHTPGLEVTEDLHTPGLEVTEDLHTPGLEGRANNNIVSSAV